MDIIFEYKEVIAIVVAIWAILSAKKSVITVLKNDRDIAKKIKILDILIDGEYTQMHENCLAVIKKNNVLNSSLGTLGKDYDKLDDEQKKDADSVYAILNHYEFLAVGIKNDVICEDFLKMSMYTSIVKIVDECESFITEVRQRQKEKNNNKDATAYDCLLELKIRWAGNNT